MRASLKHITGPLVESNPVTLQILGICSALAVTTSVATALTMSLALTAVLVAASAVISAIRRHIPASIRLILQITIVASMVIVIDLFLQAFAFQLSQRLSIFVSLIVTNCVVLGRAEAFAMRNPMGASMLDALGNGLGYSAVLLLVGAVRELLGVGALLGYPILPTVATGGWFVPLGVMLLAPSAFFILGLLIWALRTWRPEQTEPDEFPIVVEPDGARL